MVGTAAEVTPIREVDDQVIGRPGPVTLEIQEAYLDTCRGAASAGRTGSSTRPRRRRQA